MTWPAVFLALTIGVLALLAGFNQTVVIVVRDNPGATILLDRAGQTSRGSNDIAPELPAFLDEETNLVQ